MMHIINTVGRRVPHLLAVAVLLLLPLGADAQVLTSLGNNISTVGNLTVDSNTTLGDAAADTISFLGTVQGGSPLVFEGATADGFELTLAVTDPTADRTITLPDYTGTLATLDGTETLTNKTWNFANNTMVGQLAVANGGTGAASVTANTLVYGNGTGALQETAVGAAGELLLGTGAAPAFAAMAGDATIASNGTLTIGADAVALATDTTGNYVATVAGGNGVGVSGSGTENAAVTLSLGQLTADWVQDADFNIDLGVGGYLRLESSAGNNTWGTLLAASLSADQTWTFPNQTGTVLLDTASLNAANLTGQVAIANGGTGNASFGTNTVVLGNAGNPLNETNVGIDGQLLLARTGNAPLFATMSGDAAISNAGVVTVANDSHLHTAGTITEADPIYGAAPAASITSAGSGLVITGTERTNFGTAYSHTSLTNNPHTVTAVQVGLGSVENTALSTWVGSSNITTLGTIATGVWNGTDIAVADGGTGAGDAATARTNLGLVIGTNVQAWDTDLDSWAALATSSKADSGANTDVNSLTPTHTNWSIANGGDATFANVNTGNVVMGGNLWHSISSVTPTGTTQGAAAALTDTISHVTGGTVAVNDSVLLPNTTGNAGMQMTIINRTGYTVNVFPTGTDTINGAGAGAVKTVAATDTLQCYVLNIANSWECLTLSR